MNSTRADIVRAIVDFPFWDYGCDDFPTRNHSDGSVSEVVEDLADAIVEKLQGADNE